MPAGYFINGNQIDQVKNQLERRNGVSKNTSVPLGVILFHYPLLRGELMKGNPRPGNFAESRQEDLEWFKDRTKQIKSLLETWNGVSKKDVNLVFPILFHDPLLRDVLLKGNPPARNLGERREDDPKWFKELGSGFKDMETKSQGMEENSRRRIKNFLRKAKNRMLSPESNLNAAQRAVAKRILDEWEKKLEDEDYNSHYFSKAHHDKGAFCDADGLLRCEGVTLDGGCQYENDPNHPITHTFNPYLSKDTLRALPLFEFDHQIEKRKTVARLMELIHEGHDVRINVDYFYDLLFTRVNIRLVLTKCHEREDHTNMGLDEEQVLLPET
ncbi:DNA fragmentation factor subunit beta-like [Watersipora subatra]|uniref:DNA fragmentation factor subunit beta-like n=1 Tax=Watersipora subatra TaxID=2589382 RepID=UPI00355BACCD